MADRNASSMAREALRRAVAEPEPAIERLIEDLPAMLAEAARRRNEAADPAARIRALGHVWLPRLAAATACLIVAAWLWPQRSAKQDPTSSLDGFIVTGNVSASVADPVLEALVR